MKLLRQGQGVFKTSPKKNQARSGPLPFTSQNKPSTKQQKEKQRRQQQPQRRQQPKFGAVNMIDWVFFINDKRISDEVRNEKLPKDLNTLSDELSNYLGLTNCFWRNDINIPKHFDVSKVQRNLLQFLEKDNFQFCDDAKFKKKLDQFINLTDEDEYKLRFELRKRPNKTVRSDSKKKSSLPKRSNIGKYPTKTWKLFTDDPNQKKFASNMGYWKFKEPQK